MAAELNSKGSVLYFYGVSESVPHDAVQQAGVDLQSPIEPVSCEELVGWISRVSAEDFEENLARNMENLDWLATASVAHQRAISAIASKTEILPARFGTVFRSEASLRKHVRARQRQIARDFKRIKGADEWGIKVFAAKSVSSPIAPNVRSGKDYLQAKAALLPPRRVQKSANGDFAEFETELRKVALDSAVVGNVSGGQRGLRFQTSLLVKRKDRKKLELVLRKFSKRWAESCQIECTGPWPPYSFVSKPTRTAQE
jgi:Gas vesicle synthesis protein GvpL/GvpF